MSCCWEMLLAAGVILYLLSICPVIILYVYLYDHLALNPQEPTLSAIFILKMYSINLPSMHCMEWIKTL